MGWLILILFLLSARGKAPAATQPLAATTSAPATAVNPVTGRVLPAGLNPNLAVAGLTEVAPGVFMPDQVRDTTSAKIHAAVSLGPSIAQQSQMLLNSYLGGAVDPGGSIGNPLGEFHTEFV